MVMDRSLRGHYEAASGIKLNGEADFHFSDPIFMNKLSIGDRFVNGNFDGKYVGVSMLEPYLNTSNRLIHSAEGDSHEDYDFSDVVLKYINQILMEEDMEEKACMFQESAALQAAEKSFYDVLGEKYPPSLDQPDLHSLDPGGTLIGDYSNFDGAIGSYRNDLLCPNWKSYPTDYESSHVQNVPFAVSSRSTSQSSYSSSSSNGTAIDGPVDSPISTLRIPDTFRITDIFSDSESALQFRKGVEQASKFLPLGNGLLADFGGYLSIGKKQNEEPNEAPFKAENKYGSENAHEGPRGKKNILHDDGDLQGRSSKHSAVFSESTVRSDLFDKVLLCSGGKNESAVREALHKGSTKSVPESGDSKVSNGRKSRGKKTGGRKNVVDMRTLLTLCAQAVAADDRRTASEFLKQVREHASQNGDGMQRLAYYVADGLDARMAGSGTQIYKALITMPTSAADVLKAYQLYLATCPFRKISTFFSNKTIMNVSQKATKLHIIDFGILYGFQWPSLIQRLSTRENGPPKLRITGIDFPHPGFRPAERVEETGRRLMNYADSFNVPFEFNAIAQKWETIKLEDLKIDKDEVLIVNCLFRMRNLLDETVVINSPRDMVLNLIRKMNPDIFIQGIVNGAYNAPFFITRFREALFHFSSLFDMLEAIIPREIHERMLIEKTIFGREAMNVIACEAAERIERPETYKQWMVRNLRAGFRQLPLDEEIMKIAKQRTEAFYHKDFVIDHDANWLLQGWKGRIVYALSTWKPAS